LPDQGSMADEEKLENVATIKAYKNPDFLASHAARKIRMMCELQEPEQRLADSKIDNVFLFLGSHQVMHPEERAKLMAELNEKVKKGGPLDEMEALSAKITFNKRLMPMDKYYTVAMELAGMIATFNLGRKERKLPSYYVMTGGGPGVMEAANRGAGQAGEVSIGMSSSRPEWGSMNKYIPEEMMFEFHYFFMRKFWMMYKCMGLVALPGGLGSLDELFETLVLVSSRKITHRMPIILIGKEHWKRAVSWDYLVESGMFSQRDVDVLNFVDTAQEAFELLKSSVEEADASPEEQETMAKRRRLTVQNSTGSGKGEA